MERKDPVVGIMWLLQPFSHKKHGIRVYVPLVSFSAVCLSKQGNLHESEHMFRWLVTPAILKSYNCPN
eukprot:1136709-Pelagomonas_calceolata.AAC.10